MIISGGEMLRTVIWHLLKKVEKEREGLDAF